MRILTDPCTRRIIHEALTRLPPRAARFADRRVAFVGAGRGPVGLAVPPLPRGLWLVLLDERRRPEEIASTVAHELGHAFLGHRTPSAEHERAAATLARSWGFDGAGADPEGCARRFAVDNAYPPASLEARVTVVMTSGSISLTCACSDVVALSPVPWSDHHVALTCPTADCLREVVLLCAVPGLACPRCGTPAALSLIRDGFPLLLALRFGEGWRGFLAWFRRGAPGLCSWIRSGYPPLFSARWTPGGAIAIGCGSCRGRTIVRVAQVK